MKYMIIVGLLLGFAAPDAFADTDTVCWTAPTQRSDNTPLPPTEIGGYNVYGPGGLMQGNVTGTCVDILATSVEQIIHITAFDTDGRESIPSQTVVIAPGKSAPNPPTGVTVTRSIGNAAKTTP